MFGAAPAFADSLTVNDEDRWSGSGSWPRSAVVDTAAGDLVTMTEEPGRITITGDRRPEYESYAVSFEGPGVAGRLERGVYPDAQPSSQRQKDHPGMTFAASYYYEGWTCKRPRASFEVLDIARDLTDKITRVWIVWEWHCEGEMGSFFGEVRVGMPESTGPRTAPAQVRFPAAERGGQSIKVPVEVRGDAPITDARIVGEDFEVVSDTCESAPTCEVQVRAVPGTAGTRTATLRVTDAGGKHTDVPLEVFAYGGTTGYTMVSDPGEWVGDGKTWTYGPEAEYNVGGTRERLFGGVDGPDNEYWTFEFTPRDGDVLTPGTTYRATSGSGTGPLIDLYGMGRACGLWRGSFTVHELEFDGHDLERARISYEMDCAIDPGAFVRGTFSWHAGDTTTPPRWTVPSWPAVAPAPLPARTASVTFTHEAAMRPTWDAQAGDDITLDMSGGGLKVHANRGSYGQPISLWFYTPPTSRGVKPGVYPTTRRSNDMEREPGDAGLDVEVDGMNMVGTGSFEVREFELVDGVVTRAWILFEASEGDRTHSGEVRIGMPAADGPRSAPTTLRYGAVEVGEPGVAAPVAFWPKDGAKITDVRVVGEHAADARVRVDHCTDAPVVAGEACSVWVRFTPSAAGVRRATLRATDAAGRTTDVPLEIFARGGDTSYTVTSTMRPEREGLSPILPPMTLNYDTKADYGIGGDASRLRIIFLANLNNMWTMNFLAPPGETLQVGRYTDARWYSDRGDRPGMSVSIGVDCQHLTGEFTVHELERVNRIVTKAKVSFEIFCPEFTGSLRGTLAWRAGDATPVAPWMVATGGPVVTPTPTVTATPTATATATATATPTVTATATATTTPTATATATAVPTSTATATPVSTATATPVATTTPAATATPTSTATTTPVPTTTATPYATPGATTTPVATTTFAPPGESVTPVPTATPEPTAIPTTTPDPAATPFGTFAPAPFAAPSPSELRAAVKAAMKPCVTRARSLARSASPARRRAAAARLTKAVKTCRAEVVALPDSSARTAALATLKRHANAARTLRAKRAGAAAVRRAQKALRSG
ncbi:hypothetical protein OJ997_15570 [Solirubrobacter phytolaccae]|uniref:Uncharacterized protein n=1 Tax=Solirubrobacter phytolaccae TaxID=1404360 RepID=A0A9X3N8I7_9ACTN|nr:hypothetical protein [Solirubrobacter phytolaccae]MDA0181723.1 hypothetical protein [Solirubrobacter phytolaccae]